MNTMTESPTEHERLSQTHQDDPLQTQEDFTSQTQGEGSNWTENGLLNLELIKRRPALSEQEVIILNLFAYGMYPNSPETTIEAAGYLDSLCPPLEQHIEATQFLWTVWDVMTDVALSPETTDDMQDRLIQFLQVLQQCAKGYVKVYGTSLKVWKDLPMLSENLDACFGHDPTIEAHQNDRLSNDSVRQWLNTCAFGARIMGVGLAAAAYDEAMRVISSAFEEEPSAIPGIADCRIQAGCIWVTHAAMPLLTWAQENIGYVENGEEYMEGGPLYNGPWIMCLQRWGFWIDRFEELGKKGSALNAETREAALTAAKTMRTVERRLGRTLSEE